MKSKDFGLVCFLIYKGVKLEDYEMDSRGQLWFEFEETTATSAYQKDYFTGKAEVNLRDFLKTQDMIKSLIIQEKRNNNLY